jgi:hypothetical protein
MSDLPKEQRKTVQPQNKVNELLDLTGTSQPRYMCENCEVELFLFPQAQLYFPMERGPHYICPECHVVTDTSLTKPPGIDDIKPIDMAPPTITFVPEDRGDGILIEQPYDPEPDEDKWLKNIGATLIDKRIDVRSDF